MSAGLSPFLCAGCNKEAAPLVRRVVSVKGRLVKAWFCQACEKKIDTKKGP